MRRLLLLPVALLGLATAGALASTKQANASFTGKVARLSATSIALGDEHHRLTCAVTSYSPPTRAFAAGDRVKAACTNGVLVAIADVPSHSGDVNASAFAPTTTTNPTATNASGPITALTAASLTVQTMSCSVAPTSLLTVGFHVGDSVRMSCRNGALSELHHNDTPPPSPPTTTTTTTTTHTEPPPVSTTTTTTTTTVRTTTTTPQITTGISGTIAALASSSITVNGGDNGHASLTCSIGTGSPSTAGFATGGIVRMYCVNGVLSQLTHTDTPPPVTTTPTTTTTTPTTTTTTTTPSGGGSTTITGRTGTLTAFSTSSITVTSGEGSLTCSVVQSSPSLAGFAIGNAVRLYCTNGAFSSLTHVS